MTDDELKKIKERIENAKLSSDDHGHSCTDLRIYCENELIYAYDEMVPKLLDEIERLQNGIDFVYKERLAKAKDLIETVDAWMGTNLHELHNEEAMHVQVRKTREEIWPE